MFLKYKGPYCDECYADWLVLYLFIGLIVLFIIYVIYSSIKEGIDSKIKSTPKYKREFEKKSQEEIKRWESDYPERINSDILAKAYLSRIGEELPACKKCNSNIFRIWELNSNLMILRCESCKRKHEYLQSFFSQKSKINLNELIIQLNNYLNRNINAPTENMYWRETENLLDFSGKTAAHPNTYPFKLFCNGSLEVRIDEYVKPKMERKISQSVKDQVWRRDEGKCAECGGKENLEFDHIIPFSKGGANTYRNIQLLCEKCNRSKSNKIG